MGKKTIAPCKYPLYPGNFGVSLNCHRSETTWPSLMYAAPLRRRAGDVLNMPYSDNRLTLALALMAVMGLGLAVPMILDSLLMMADVLLLLSDTAQVAWVLILHGCLLGLFSIFFTLPLLAALCRMAVLMTEAHRKRESGQPGESIGLGELWYPFTSAKAYGRTLCVALRGIGYGLLILSPAVAVMTAAFWWMPLVKYDLIPLTYVLLWAANIGVSCLITVLLAIACSRRIGYAYFAFACPELSLKEAGRLFQKSRPVFGLPLWMMLGYSGWIFLSLIAVFLPFVFHTLPHMLLAGASYGRFLMDTGLPADDVTQVSPATIESLGGQAYE